MDTRRKILTPSQAIACAAELRANAIPFKVISGHFDILQADLVRRLTALASPNFRIFAVVSDPEHPVTTAAARLELAASLRVIDYVVHCVANPADLVQKLQPAEWIREEAAHLAGTERLIQCVLERHGRLAAAGTRERSH
jgi:bifunctional ADP-heptose synthase (sugar kinase/adenylyltransferase)